MIANRSPYPCLTYTADLYVCALCHLQCTTDHSVCTVIWMVSPHTIFSFHTVYRTLLNVGIQWLHVKKNHTGFTGMNIKSTYVVFSLSQDLLGVLQSYLSTILAQCCLHHLHHQWLVLLPSSDLQVRSSKFYCTMCCLPVSFLVFGLQMSLLWLLCSAFPCHSLCQDHAFNLVLLFHT